jgi:hypothetical protein
MRVSYLVLALLALLISITLSNALPVRIGRDREIRLFQTIGGDSSVGSGAVTNNNGTVTVGGAVEGTNSTNSTSDNGTIDINNPPDIPIPTIPLPDVDTPAVDVNAKCSSCALKQCPNPNIAMAVPDVSNLGSDEVCSRTSSGFDLLLTQAKTEDCRVKIRSLICDTAESRGSSCTAGTPSFFKSRCEALLPCLNAAAESEARRNDVCNADLSRIPAIPDIGGSINTGGDNTAGDYNNPNNNNNNAANSNAAVSLIALSAAALIPIFAYKF